MLFSPAAMVAQVLSPCQAGLAKQDSRVDMVVRTRLQAFVTTAWNWHEKHPTGYPD
jgi:hypothetical protein